MHTITSADGAQIAVEQRGDGRPVVLIGGAFNDRSTMTALAAALAAAGPYRTVQYDRRGRGESGPVPTGLSAADRRELELNDLASVLDHVGEAASVFGHSSGGVLALEAAAAGLPVASVAVYEPSYVVAGTRPQPPADLGERVAALVEKDDRDGAVALFLGEAAGVPDEFLDAMRHDAGTWAGMSALAHTLPNDIALHGPRQSVPDHLAGIEQPVLVLDGGASPDWQQAAAAAVAAAVGTATRRTLPGQDHGVLWSPEPLVAPLTSFLA